MQVVMLSDHGGDQLDQSIRRLHAVETDVADWNQAYQDAWQELQGSRRAKPWWRRALGISTVAEQEATVRVQFARYGIAEADHERQQAEARAHQQAAGVDGEQALVHGLAGLDDSWVMLRGYRNRRGETDHVLVGPAGVWAVEVKRRRIRLHVSGYQWWYEKLSARGQVVETGWAVDGSGRTWGEQVTQVATDLGAWLARNHHPVPIRTAVMIMHEQAAIGCCEHPAVNTIGTRPEHLLWAIERSGTLLTPATCQQIVDLIRRDHRFHNQRRV
ncbi:hypothetical protein BJY16_007510 [Actinoplanes octamycinicus]|uniref:NERD domain-containing protein n=1 Tax=Actinoplanes octamycinicus TaxID=135948 RepID=A0A7W7H4W2_9ACTN|nr:nuclease-related domain-containing protein [Actinoplanes octamycinicus]MBB4744051.1 hypothetical protein [Actinoplanes octamycinicus]GIE56992.1 hypothetical protein Aoc01nite_23940 [Actinoplanes octamycinicus]